jgi:hypothetical protein
VASVLGVPLACGAIALAVDDAHHIEYQVKLNSGTIVAVAAVLVAIHVVASELAADRLPGLVARATSVPLPLWAGYGCVTALYLLAVWQPDRHDAHTKEVLAIGVIAGLGVCLALSLWRLLSRTDNAVAGRIFASGEVRRAIRSGRAVGRMNRTVLAARSQTTALMWVRPDMSAPLSVRREPILSPDEGYLVLRLRELRRLGRSDWWREGGRLWLTAVLGTLVHPGDEVGSVVPGRDETLSERTREDADRVFGVEALPGAERTAEAISALIELASRLAGTGNESGAARVARRAVDVLHAHLNSVERTRGSLPPGEIGAPVGVARAAALALSAALARADNATSREVLTVLAQRALPRCTRADSFVAVLIAQLPELTSAEGGAEQLLWDCGRRTTELNDGVISRLWWETAKQLARHQSRRDEVLTVAGRVVQYASVIDSPGTESEWGRLRGELDPTKARDQLIIVRVGASALLVGNVSLAVLVARSLPVGAWPLAAERLHSSTLLDYEVASDQLYGHLLGPQPVGALADFVSLGTAVADNVT